MSICVCMCIYINVYKCFAMFRMKINFLPQPLPNSCSPEAITFTLVFYLALYLLVSPPATHSHHFPSPILNIVSQFF